jgi:HD-like signal output (HDOD) protein
MTDLTSPIPLAPQDSPTQVSDEPGDGSGGVLDALMQRMRSKSDFPALTTSVLNIQRLAASETESISNITNEILKDVALTNKLLRLVNSAHFAQSSSIATVSRAVSLVGLHGIRNMTFSLVLLEHMHDKANAELLKEEYLRGLMAGVIASELATTSAEGEEAFIGALFQNLGRMLAQFYFPAEATNIRALMTAKPRGLSEESASTKVLGISFETLGVGVARAWGLPESIQRCMTPPSGDPPPWTVVDMAHKVRWISRAANDMADIMLQSDPKVLDAHLDTAAKRFGKTLGLSHGQVQKATTLARKKLVDIVEAMDLHMTGDSKMASLFIGAVPAPEVSPPVKVSPYDRDALKTTELHATPAPPPVASSAPSPQPNVNPAHVAQTLAAGIQDITNAMVEDAKLSDVLRMILETMYRALDFHRLVFCMRDPKLDALTGRFGLGAGVEGIVHSFYVPLNGGARPDLFTAICLKGADTLISDTSDPRLADRLPAWYSKLYNAPTFLILPVAIKGKPVGLIYADKSVHGGLQVDEKELALLRTLRNQAVMAFKQLA